MSLAPLQILLTIRHQIRVSSVVCADVTIRHPDSLKSSSLNSNTNATTPKAKSVGKQSSGSSKHQVDIATRFVLVLVGDDDGFVHVSICDEAKTVVCSDTFRAHNTGITHIVSRFSIICLIFCMQ